MQKYNYMFFSIQISLRLPFNEDTYIYNDRSYVVYLLLNHRVQGMKCVYNYCLHYARIQKTLFTYIYQSIRNYLLCRLLSFRCLQATLTGRLARLGRLKWVALKLREFHNQTLPVHICLMTINGCGCCFGFPYLMLCGNQRFRKASESVF